MTRELFKLKSFYSNTFLILTLSDIDTFLFRIYIDSEDFPVFLSPPQLFVSFF